jgi:hypothetical protein
MRTLGTGSNNPTPALTNMMTRPNVASCSRLRRLGNTCGYCFARYSCLCQTNVMPGGAKGTRSPTGPAKIGSELGRMFDHGVARPLCVLPICAAVLRDVTVLWAVVQPLHPTGRAPWQLPRPSSTVSR